MKTFNFIKFDTIDSTNLYAMNNIADLPDKQIIIASTQTAGKGQFGRKWESASDGNVYMSIVLKPSLVFNNNLPLANITQYMSVIICKILKNYNVNAQIKWPNDVLVNGAKIAGILSEASFRGTELKGIVLGVGINLNKTKKELQTINQPATSLNLLLNQNINKNLFIEQLVQQFFYNYEHFLERGFTLIKNEYIDRSFYLHKEIILKTHAGSEKGIAQKINDNGSLLFISNGNEKVINAGELILSSD